MLEEGGELRVFADDFVEGECLVDDLVEGVLFTDNLVGELLNRNKFDSKCVP